MGRLDRGSRGRDSGRGDSGGFSEWKASGGPRGRSSGGFRGRNSGRDSGRGRMDRGSGRVEMHEVICDKCGEKCEVPFKPTSSKPVYCSDCFKKNDSSGSDRRSSRPDTSSKDLEKINAKLDKILTILEDK